MWRRGDVGVCMVWCQLHRSQHGKKWFDCQPCRPPHDVKEHFEAPASKRRPVSGDRGKFVAAVDVHKNNDITDKKDSVHRKKSTDGDKSHHKSAVAGHRTKKIGIATYCLSSVHVLYYNNNNTLRVSTPPRSQLHITSWTLAASTKVIWDLIPDFRIDLDPGVRWVAAKL